MIKRPRYSALMLLGEFAGPVAQPGRAPGS